MSTMFWIWAAAVVVFLILEMFTPTLVFLSLVGGSVAAGIYSLVSPDAYYWQIGVFLAVSAILLPLTRPLAKRLTRDDAQKSNVDALKEKTGIVIKPIDPDLGGQVKVEGEVWNAQADEPIELDQKVTIVSITGTKLHVKKKD